VVRLRITAEDLNGIIRRKRLGLPVHNIQDYIYKPGVYGFSATAENKYLAGISENARIDRGVFEGIQRGVNPKVRQKLVNLIKKVRKKSGKTYYQRAQTAQLTTELKKEASKPITAKKYVKGVDFSYGKLVSFNSCTRSYSYLIYWSNRNIC
jgi:hypothetical protein